MRREHLVLAAFLLWIPIPSSAQSTQAAPLAKSPKASRTVAVAHASRKSSDVPFQRLLHADAEPQNWLMYGGDYRSLRFSNLNQINRQNVASLKAAWIYQPGAPGAIEASPVVVDGIMYVVEPPSTVTALDARTGTKIWTWSPVLPPHFL